MMRFSKARPCPVCAGYPELPAGRGSRCWGFFSADGAYAHCTRGEHANGLPLGRDGAYAHRLRGDCLCGLQHGDAPIRPPLKPRAPRAEPSELARRLWRQSRPAAGTIVEAYLRSRGLDGPIPPTIRFSPRLWHAETGQHWPAMLAAVTHWPGTRVVAVHRTYLTPDGHKADVRPAKKSLGPCGGGAVRLARFGGERLAITEGIETGLTVQLATGIPTWVALSAAGMRSLVLPALPLAGEVIIAADADDAGRAAARFAAARWRAEGRRVWIAAPPRGDWNDLLREVA
jgi:putative DNA primase/helicase